MNDINKQIKLAQGGDEKAFQKLYDTYYKKAYYLALKIMNNEADAKDVAQETFIQIHKSISSLKDITLFQSWMNKIVVSKCNRIFVKNKETYLDPDIIKKSNKAIEHRIQMNPEKHIEKKTDQEILLDLLNQLKPKQREVLVLMYLCEFKQQEIAELLNVNLNTIKSRSMYAKEELKNLVEAYEKNNDYRFKFRVESIGTALSLAFTAEMSMLLGTSSMVTTFTTMLSKAGTILTGNAVQVVAGIVLVGSTLAIGNTIMNPQTENTIEPVISSSHSNPEQSYEQEPFTPVTYNNKTYTTSKDAYFALVNWANTPELIQNKPKEEIMEAKVLLQSIKETNNVYYHMLEAQKIIQYIEAM